jgi:uncharacterized protein YdaU (DUF1376 family)
MTDGVDVRCLPYMPLQIERLRRSKAWLRCKRRPEMAFYLMNLWMRAWHEVPSGSIEADDDVLADAAMCDPEAWTAIKAEVLCGWELRDGRYHHPVVEEIAADAETKLRSNRRRTESARQALQQKRSQSDDEPEAEAVTSTVTASVTENVTGHEGKGREGNRSSLRSDLVGEADLRSPPEPDPDPHDDVAEAFEAYNAEAALVGWPAARRLDTRRRSALRQRLAECGGLPGWRNALARARASPHLTGANDRGWTADLDFLLQAKSFTRLLEGAYDDRRPRRDEGAIRSEGIGRRTADQHPLDRAFDRLDERFRSGGDA